MGGNNLGQPGGGDKFTTGGGAMGFIERGLQQHREYQERRWERQRQDWEDDKPIAIGGFLVLFAFTLPLWWGPFLWILAFISTFIVPAVGVFLIIRSSHAGGRQGRAVNAEIEAMANDASFDVSEQIIVWDKLRISKGIGTSMEGREDEIADFCRRLIDVRAEISEAATPHHKIEAVLAADAVLAAVRSVDLA